MDNPILGWNIESGQNKSLGVDDGLVELLWQNGQVVLNSQTHRKPGYGNDTSKHEEGGTIRIRNPSNLCEVDETDSWIDESFEKEVSWQFEGNRTTGHQSIMTVGSSHCGSNDQVVIKNFGGKLSPRSESMERATVITTSSGSSFGKTTCDQSTDNINFNSNKRKIREEDTSDQLEPGPGGGKSSRTSRAAQVHNLSERRRRDRINEKMRALQELIPHSNKSDKASMLDEAIEYMKSLQLQVQMMWMGNGIFQQYMSRMGMGMGLGMGIVPSIHNVPIHLLRMPLQVDQQISMQNHAAIHQNPVLNPVINYQNPKFHDQYANYMAFHQLQNASQPMNMFNFRSHTSQQNHMQPPAKSNGSNGQL